MLHRFNLHLLSTMIRVGRLAILKRLGPVGLLFVVVVVIVGKQMLKFIKIKFKTAAAFRQFNFFQHFFF